jgi:hypothetical protein
MAEWQRIQNPERMNDPLKLEIPLDLTLYGAQACQHIVMRVDYSFGLAGRARRKDDLQRVIFVKTCDRLKQRLARERRVEILEGDLRYTAVQSPKLLLTASHKFGTHLRDDSSNKIRRAGDVERDRHHTAQDTSEK